jgi:integrase
MNRKNNQRVKNAFLTLINSRQEKLHRNIAHYVNFPFPSEWKEFAAYSMYNLLALDLPFPVDVASLNLAIVTSSNEKWERQHTYSELLLSNVTTSFINKVEDKDIRNNLKYAFASLTKNNIINLSDVSGALLQVQDFSFFHPAKQVIEKINNVTAWSQATKNTYLQVFRDFSRYVYKLENGIPCKEFKDYFCFRQNLPQNKISLLVCLKLFQLLEQRAFYSNFALRDYLLIKLLFYSSGKVSYVRLLEISYKDIDFNNHVVKPGKTPILCEKNYLNLLKAFIGRRRGRVFVTDKEKALCRSYLSKKLVAMSIELNILPHITPSSLQEAIYLIMSEVKNLNKPQVDYLLRYPNTYQ